MNVGAVWVVAQLPQGQCVGRDGRIEVTLDADGKVGVGGACVTCIDGRLHC